VQDARVSPAADPTDPAGGDPAPGSTARGPTATHLVPLREATRVWFLISLQTFGGPAGQIAMMQRELVDERRWIGQRRFLHALAFCTLLPGPEAQQLSIYVGWLLNGIKGGLVAGTLFVLPGVVALLSLSALYVGLGDTTAVEALFAGLAPAVLAIVAQAVWRLSGRALGHPVMVGVAVAAFLALAALAVPFPAVLAAAALVGWLLGRVAPHVLPHKREVEAEEAVAPLIPDDALHREPASRGHSARVLVVGLLVWAAPVVLVAVLTGRDSVFVDQSLFFSGAALVTFGGAYAVLTYVAQQAVQVYGWLAPGEMVRGLALAESTPGPLIMVVQFVAFLGAYRDPGGLDPWVAGVLASLLTVWVTFVPCFVFIFLGAPHVERLRGNEALSAALAGITAAVVGVIANLALFFALATLFDDQREVGAGPVSVDLPVLASADPVALGLLALASALLLWRGWGVLRVLGVCAVVGVALGLLGAPV
jgi:chromate transporter